MFKRFRQMFFLQKQAEQQAEETKITELPTEEVEQNK